MRAVSVNVSIPHTKPCPRKGNVLKPWSLEPTALAADGPIGEGFAAHFFGL